MATREAILDAAVSAFATSGFSGTSTRMICERAGVTPATVYHHFGSKRNLYIEAFNFAISAAYARYEAAVAGLDSIRDELTAMLQCALTIMHDHYEITALAIRAQTDLSHEEMDLHFKPKSTLDFEARMIERAIARGELDAGDAPIVEMLIPALLWGLSMTGRDEQMRRTVVEAFERLIDASLFTVKRSRLTADPG